MLTKRAPARKRPRAVRAASNLEARALKECYLPAVRYAAEKLVAVAMADLAKLLKPVQRHAARSFSASDAYDLPEKEAKVIAEVLRAHASRITSKRRGAPHKAGIGYFMDAQIMRQIGAEVAQGIGVDKAAEIALAAAEDKHRKIARIWAQRFPNDPLKESKPPTAAALASRYRRARNHQS